ncbi:long-chain-fatty-acid--CoA ligase [Lewinellaceae bacterium SD302]|nr:long-chain-fatty-acid--CoA ligase [Lewinellaceae bacterium SD302]
MTSSAAADQRPWLANYPKEIPANIEVDRFPTLKALIENAFATHQNKPAFSCMGKRLTFAETDRLSTAFGAYLHYRGLQPGDRVALMMPNLLQYPIALFGAIKAGVIVVNTNPLYTPREMKHQFTDSGATAIVIAEPFAANLEKIIGETDIKTVITTSLGEMLSFPKKQIVNFVVRTVKRMVPKYELPGAVSFAQALSEGKKYKLPDYEAKPEDIVALQYTGGTTGVSKGAMLTNRNMAANTLQSNGWFGPFLGDQVAAMLCPLPLYHIFAFTVNCLSMLHHGAESVLITNPRDLSTVVKAFKDNKISGLTGVNTLFNALNNDPDFQKLDFSELKITVGGGTAVQRPVAEAWQKLTGVPLSEGYGLTETSPSAIMNPLDGRFRLGHVGLPLPNTDVRIWMEEEKRAGAPEEVGEIQIKGPQVMKGYYNRPEETAKVFLDGWLCTGDIGMMTEDGFFKIVDRKKDMILVSGFNVFPNEIEDVLAGHPKVLELAAVGVPDERSGEKVKVFVVRKDDSLTKDELIAFARENLTGYKVPKLVEFRDELPKTNVGKILRRHLRE